MPLSYRLKAKQPTQQDGLHRVIPPNHSSAARAELHTYSLARWINAPTTSIELVHQNIMRNHQVNLHFHGLMAAASDRSITPGPIQGQMVAEHPLLPLHPQFHPRLPGARRTIHVHPNNERSALALCAFSAAPSHARHARTQTTSSSSSKTPPRPCTRSTSNAPQNSPRRSPASRSPRPRTTGTPSPRSAPRARSSSCSRSCARAGCPCGRPAPARPRGRAARRARARASSSRSRGTCTRSARTGSCARGTCCSRAGR